MLRSKFAFAFLAASLAFGASLESAKADAGIASFNTYCIKDFRNWKKLKGWKAYAVTNIYLIGYTEWQSCGSSSEYSVKVNAVTVALSGCRSELRKKHAPKSAQCTIRQISR